MPDAREREVVVDPPLDHLVAVWLGMSTERIEQGLREGWIVRTPAAGSDGPSLHDSGAAATTASDADAAAPTSDPVGTVDRARVQALLQRLDRTLDDATFGAAWEEAGLDDAERVSAFAGFIADALGVAGGAADADSFGALEAAAVNASGDARFVRLSASTGAALERIALGDGSLRRALAEHARWALSGDRALARLADPEGRYDRFDRDSGDALLSDAWVGDRARHAAWRHARDAGRPLETDGDGWRFVDRNAGEDATLEVKGAGDGPVHQVIFSRDGGDRVTGGSATDRVHGGDGDDVLRGRGGDDLLEGGRGDDLLQGGSGRDDIAGQQGGDELDGGAGDDRLDGGAGSDELAGGRGDDLLRGGSGEDVYRFERGDGLDTLDDDGGAIVIDDVAVSGTMQADGSGGWINADGVRFSLDGDVSSGGTLTLRTGEDETHGIRIAGWKQGAFGITLAPASGAVEGRDDANDVGASPASLSIAAVAHGEPGNEASSGFSIGDDIGHQLAQLASDPLGDARLVDTSAVARAVDAWSIPSPPDVAAAPLGDVGAVTVADVADALALDGGADDEAADAGAQAPVFEVPFAASMSLVPDANRMPRQPDLLLRPSH